MGRRIKDKEKERFLKRIRLVEDKKGFLEKLLEFRARIQKMDVSIFDDKNIDWDLNLKSLIYYGAFYDLRELFDDYGLSWPTDVKYLMKVIDIKQQKGNINSTQPTFFPPKNQWLAWKMARTDIGGFGHPNEDEIKEAEQFGKGQGASTGFTRGVIAGLVAPDVELKTISNWIKKCREYLINDGDQYEVANILNLGFLEWIELSFWIESRKGQDTGIF